MKEKSAGPLYSANAPWGGRILRKWDFGRSAGAGAEVGEPFATGWRAHGLEQSAQCVDRDCLLTQYLLEPFGFLYFLYVFPIQAIIIIIITFIF